MGKSLVRDLVSYNLHNICIICVFLNNQYIYIYIHAEYLCLCVVTTANYTLSIGFLMIKKYQALEYV